MNIEEELAVAKAVIVALKKVLLECADELTERYDYPTDQYGLCIECGVWAPNRHREAHEHRAWCNAPEHKAIVARRAYEVCGVTPKARWIYW